MLAGYQTSAVGCFFVDDLKEFVNAGLEFFLLQVIGALVDMKVSVACVTKGFDGQATKSR